MKIAISKTKGFTLVELMVATLIIGILISLSIAASGGAKKSARDGKRKADLEQIRSALEMYKSDEEEYPSGSGDASTALTTPLSGYLIIPSDPGSYSYYYRRISENQYELCAHLETGETTALCGSNCSGVCNYKATNP